MNFFNPDRGLAFFLVTQRMETGKLAFIMCTGRQLKKSAQYSESNSVISHHLFVAFYLKAYNLKILNHCHLWQQHWKPCHSLVFYLSLTFMFFNIGLQHEILF